VGEKQHGRVFASRPARGKPNNRSDRSGLRRPLAGRARPLQKAPMRAIALAALLMLCAGSCFAALPPQYYELARAAAPDVVVVEVRSVRTPLFWQSSGDCELRGRVDGVERGARYHEGDAITLRVPCKKPNAPIPDSGTVWQDMDALKHAARARVFLDQQGGLALDQIDLLD
jgi:hypothetical protein